MPPSDVSRSRRRNRTFLIVACSVGAVLMLAFVLAFVIHFVLLGTDRFNWLEAPKHSSQPSISRVG